jgi:hypothetical protein
MSIFNTQESQNFRLMGNAPRSSHFDNFMTQMSKNYRSDQITPIRAQQQRGFYFYWIKVNRVFDSPKISDTFPDNFFSFIDRHSLLGGNYWTK